VGNRLGASLVHRVRIELSCGVVLAGAFATPAIAKSLIGLCHHPQARSKRPRKREARAPASAKQEHPQGQTNRLG